jgi:hypothetical protein
MPRQKRMTAEAVGLKYGFRSGLEEKIAEQLVENEVDYEYEKLVLQFLQPEVLRTYTPDFAMIKHDGTPLIVETKGRLTLEDRKKMKWVKEQYPDLDIRLLFCNSRAKISKGAKSSYGDWCNKLGYPYADKVIPKEWLEEVKKKND